MEVMEKFRQLNEVKDKIERKIACHLNIFFANSPFFHGYGYVGWMEGRIFIHEQCKGEEEEWVEESEKEE